MQTHTKSHARRRWLTAAPVALAMLALAPSALARHHQTLQPPTGLVATGGNQQVILNWTASSSSNVGGYRVYRENANGTWPTTPLSTTSASTTSYTDTGLTNGTTYTYRVTTIDTATPPNESVPSNTASATPSTTTSGPCGTTTTAPATYDHVVWILMENHSYNEIIGSPSAPYINQIAGQCGLATNYFAVSHPSLPNYIALTSGSTQGITDDNPPSSHPLNVPSIFSQLDPGNWRSLEESMPSNCDKSDSGEYAVRHDPATYYTNLSDCSTLDVPLGSTPDLSAKFTFVTPNLIDDMHDGTVQQGDTWLSTFLPKVLSSAEYQAGKTAVYITWDEDDGSQNNQVSTIVIAPSVTPGTRSSTQFTHYSMLRTTEEQLGLGLLGNAATATSMRSAFGF
jgi:phosphatidylinositol-3-phosphatase